MIGPAVALPCPRDIAGVRLEPGFHRLQRDIWGLLKAEVLETCRLGEAG